jgi:hypothetical protein
MKSRFVSKKGNHSALGLLKVVNVPIRVTESIARKGAKSGDYGDHITCYTIASIWEHDR